MIKGIRQYWRELDVTTRVLLVSIVVLGSVSVGHQLFLL